MSETAALLELSWWFHEGALAQADARELVETLSATVPECLPRRYGPWEPPQYALEELGLDHFLEFVRGQRQLGFVWRSTPPVAGLTLLVPPRIGGSADGFRSGYLRIAVDQAALARKRWAVALRTLWRRVSLVIRPFYGEVPTLGGYDRQRGRFRWTEGTELPPVNLWWWKGLPPGPVHEAVLGSPYRERWPAFVASGVEEGGLVFASTPDWREPGDALANIGLPPPEIALVPRKTRAEPDIFPPDWPFEPPFVPL